MDTVLNEWRSCDFYTPRLNGIWLVRWPKAKDYCAASSVPLVSSLLSFNSKLKTHLFRFTQPLPNSPFPRMSDFNLDFPMVYAFSIREEDIDWYFLIAVLVAMVTMLYKWFDFWWLFIFCHLVFFIVWASPVSCQSCLCGFIDIIPIKKWNLIIL